MTTFDATGLDDFNPRKLAIPLLALLITVAATGLIPMDASADGVLPVSPVYLQATAADNGLQVKPATITYTGDGTGLLAGAHARGQRSGIRWTRWTAHGALGTGFNQLNNCTPSCAGGTFRRYPVKIEMWRPRKLGATLVFTRLTIFYKNGPPPGEPHHYTFTDSYTRGNGGGYGWGPPDEQGYCVNTNGLKPFADCKNIHSLPQSPV